MCLGFKHYINILKRKKSFYKPFFFQKITFNSQVFHPAIDYSSGVLSLSEVFPQWDKKENHIWQILKYLHCIFYNLNIKVPANNDASSL